MSGEFLVLAMTQEALPALPNQNDEEAARDEKGPEIFHTFSGTGRSTRRRYVYASSRLSLLTRRSVSSALIKNRTSKTQSHLTNVEPNNESQSDDQL